MSPEERWDVFPGLSDFLTSPRETRLHPVVLSCTEQMPNQKKPCHLEDNCLSSLLLSYTSVGWGGGATLLHSEWLDIVPS